MKRRITNSQSGVMLVELLVAIPVGLIVIGIVYSLAYMGMNLVGRNLSTNIAHLSVLNSIQRLTTDIHASVMEPKLTDANLAVVSGAGPAVGLAVDLYVAGPFAVFNNSNKNTKDIQIDLAGATVDIRPGMNVHIPSYKDTKGMPIMKKITGVTNGTYPRLSFADVLGVDIITQDGTGGGSYGSYIVPVYITLPVNYYVSGGSLLRSEAGNAKMAMRSVLTPKPFTKPDARDPRFVGIKLGATNSEYSARGYKSTDMLLDNIVIPSRGQLSH